MSEIGLDNGTNRPTSNSSLPERKCIRQWSEVNKLHQELRLQPNCDNDKCIPDWRMESEEEVVDLISQILQNIDTNMIYNGSNPILLNVFREFGLEFNMNNIDKQYAWAILITESSPEVIISPCYPVESEKHVWLHTEEQIYIKLDKLLKIRYKSKSQLTKSYLFIDTLNSPCIRRNSKEACLALIERKALEYWDTYGVACTFVGYCKYWGLRGPHTRFESLKGNPFAEELMKDVDNEKRKKIRKIIGFAKSSVVLPYTHAKFQPSRQHVLNLLRDPDVDPEVAKLILEFVEKIYLTKKRWTKFYEDTVMLMEYKLTYSGVLKMFRIPRDGSTGSHENSLDTPAATPVGSFENKEKLWLVI